MYLWLINIVDYIWKSANLEGIGIIYPETQAIYDGGVVNEFMKQVLMTLI